MNQKKAAFVAVVGRPSVGKSTLINRICGEKVAIVSAAPQTTRNAIRGIVNREQGQLVFIDTPGRHNSEKKFNKKLMEVSDRAVNEADLTLYVLDASRPPGTEERAIAELLRPLAERTVAAVNKIDMLKKGDLRDAACSGIRKFLEEQLSGLSGDRCFAISAKNNEGVDALLAALYAMAPEGEPFYGGDYYTDQEVDFRVAEIIREQAINRLRQELPHSLYVEVADTEFLPEKDGARRLWVRAFIIVERESQKGMVVGKGGEMIKAIRQAAQKDLDRIFDWKTALDLRVKTGKDWRHNDSTLRRIIETAPRHNFSKEALIYSIENKSVLL
ncbi:MAG: GTPase Era [Treponema sp.]|jgi:GTP-binding protein Era|nr:GTPase Era [Treponema sp.]